MPSNCSIGPDCLPREPSSCYRYPWQCENVGLSRAATFGTAQGAAPSQRRPGNSGANEIHRAVGSGKMRTRKQICPYIQIFP